VPKERFKIARVRLKEIREGNAMAQSVEELRSESERTRAALAATVDQLKERLSETAEDIRQKVSPGHIKSEVSDYISQKTQGWFDALKQQATDNPMQAIAAGTAVAVPVLRLARAFPLPLLMIGAGLVLSSKGVRSRAAEATAPAMDKARDMLNQTAEGAQAVGNNLKDAVSLAENRVGGVANDARDRAAGFAEDLRTQATQTTSTVTDKLKTDLDAANDTVERARSIAKDTVDTVKNVATAAPVKTRQLIRENAVVIGGLGIAIGAIIAAALPKTEAEAHVMGGPSEQVKQAAKQATQAGFEAAKNATRSAADAASNSVAQTDLGTHASRMAQNMADTFEEAAEDAVRAAFDPSQKPNTRENFS
jgi:hypothetical protein